MAKSKSPGKSPTKGSKKAQDEEPEYEVEKILQQKTQRGKPLYLVKWKGFPESDATWEPESNLSNSTSLLQAFKKGSDDKGSNKSDSGIQKQSKKIRKASSSPGRPAKKAAGKPTKQPKAAKSTKAAKNEKEKRDTSKSPARGRQKKESSGGSKNGSFDNDLPSKITDHGVIDDDQIRDVTSKTSFDKLFFSVEWQTRRDGNRPADSFFPFSTLKSKCPDVLLDYIHKMTCSE